MAEQETLIQDARVAGTPFDASVHGLWTRFVDNHTVRHGEWLAACEGKAFVGTCTHCGDLLQPRWPHRAGNRWDYEAECRNGITQSWVDGKRVVAGCGSILCAPGGRLAKRKAIQHGRTGER